MKVRPFLNLMFPGILAITIAGMVALGREPYQPAINPANFRCRIDNPFFPLVPGTVRRYLERRGGETLQSEITVTAQTKIIIGVRCVGVHDVITQNGEMKEDTWEWYAQDKQGAVWYFGDATQEFKAGGRISTEGSWQAGIDGAQPGIIMPAETRAGQPYRQNYLAGRIEDMGEIVAHDQIVTVPAGTFQGCLLTKEWSLLESGTEKKWYARGVGVVRSQATGGEVVTLLSIKRP